MDIYRKELKEIYERQELKEEELDADVLATMLEKVRSMVELTGRSAVITDIARDESWFIPGLSIDLLDLPEDERAGRLIKSSDEDFLYMKMHPEDLVDLRMLEYEFFKAVDCLSSERKLQKAAVADIRMGAGLTPVSKSTQVLLLSSGGGIRLMLCCYEALGRELSGTNPRIIDTSSGAIQWFSFAEARTCLLTRREKEVLTLIRAGHLSKEIARELCISVNTVNRHRQNILEKLSVGNSFEAVRAAEAMKLL